jgi:hypothetical protein
MVEDEKGISFHIVNNTVQLISVGMVFQYRLIYYIRHPFELVEPLSSLSGR